MPSIHSLQRKKDAGEAITWLTCYDYTFATLLAKTDIDAVLVGDSYAMVMAGYSNTTHARVSQLAYHTEAVARGMPNKLIVADMPFLSYRQSLEKSVQACGKLIRAGAQAVKIEGTYGNEALIRHLDESGVPVVGHIGLTPQLIHGIGGHRLQGRNDDDAVELLNQAKTLQDAGVSALVLECMPSSLAKKITETLRIPTIGIGAGAATDGQVLVLQDMLGLNPAFKPKFLRHFADGEKLVMQAVADYVNAVQAMTYPSDVESYA